MGINNTFCCFKTHNDILYLIYSNEKNSIIIFDIDRNTKVTVIIKAHDKFIYNLRHHLFEKEQKDLLLSISEKNDLKIWNIDNCECILCLPNKYNNACFMNLGKKILYIAASFNSNFRFNKNVDIYNIGGKQIQSIAQYNRVVERMESFFNEKNGCNYLIIGHENSLNFFNFTKNMHCKTFSLFENTNEYINSRINFKLYSIIKFNRNICCSFYGGIICVFDFPNFDYLYRIKLTKKDLFDILFIDGNYLVASNDGNLKLIDIINQERKPNINSTQDKINYFITIKKISHPKHGEILLAQRLNNSKIQMYTIKYEYE